MLISPTTFSARARAIVWRRMSALYVGVERVWRQRAGAVPGMHPGPLDVLHDAADHDLGAVAMGAPDLRA
jgi:hypothetical protein